jgi:hypothetical protein
MLTERKNVIILCVKFGGLRGQKIVTIGGQKIVTINSQLLMI